VLPELDQRVDLGHQPAQVSGVNERCEWEACVEERSVFGRVGVCREVHMRMGAAVRVVA